MFIINSKILKSPLFGVLNDQDAILVLRGDPIYSGIVPAEKSLKLSEIID